MIKSAIKSRLKPFVEGFTITRYYLKLRRNARGTIYIMEDHPTLRDLMWYVVGRIAQHFELCQELEKELQSHSEPSTRVEPLQLECVEPLCHIST